MNSDRSQLAVLPRSYSRPRWKHAIRFIALVAVVALDAGVVNSSFRAHFMAHKAVTVSLLLKELVMYIMVLFTNGMVLPRIVLEANRVDVDSNHITFHNLLFKRVLTWEQILAVQAPTYLKFAIIKTTGWFQLINKKDMPGYEELIQTIQTKAESAES